MTPKCPLRFKEHTSNEADQRCQADCAWLMADINDNSKACAAAVLAMYVDVDNCYVPVNERKADA